LSERVGFAAQTNIQLFSRKIEEAGLHIYQVNNRDQVRTPILLLLTIIPLTFLSIYILSPLPPIPQIPAPHATKMSSNYCDYVEDSDDDGDQTFFYKREQCSTPPTVFWLRPITWTDVP
jgi:hypothetical protein